jgi:hypothetical protein
MALERGEAAALVALEDAGGWRIERVELGGPASGTRTELAASGGTGAPPVRGLASLGRSALVFTAGSALLHLDYREPAAPSLGTLRTGLAAPLGIVVDPLPPHRVYVSEHDADRILAIELDSHASLPVVVDATELAAGALEGPGALALENGGSRLLVASSSPGGGSRESSPGQIGARRTSNARRGPRSTRPSERVPSALEVMEEPSPGPRPCSRDHELVSASPCDSGRTRLAAGRRSRWGAQRLLFSRR